MLDRIQSSADRLISAIASHPEAYTKLREFTRGQVPSDEVSRRLFARVPEKFDKDIVLEMWRNAYRLAADGVHNAHVALREVAWATGLRITGPDGTVYNEREEVVKDTPPAEQV